jgi:hypothetical protein
MIFRLFLAALYCVILAGPAHAFWVVPAVQAIVAGVTAFGATTIGAFVLKTFAYMALSALQRARRKKNSRTASGLKRDATTTGDAIPQSFVLGRYATGANAVCPTMSHGNFNGVPNGYLTYVLDFGDLPHGNLDEIYIDGELITLDGSNASNWGEGCTGTYEGRVWVKYYDGRQTEADPFLLEKFGDYPERPWSDDMVGVGIPYFIATIAYDREIFSSFPKWRFVINGIDLYDPRKDSTVGGSGAHRWNDPGTWEPSENAIVNGYNILKGITLNSGDVWGGGASFDDLPLSVWAAAMTAADPESEGGGAPIEGGFRIGFEVDVDEEPMDIFDKCMQAASAEYVEVGGTWLVRVGPPALPVYFFTDDDVLRTRDQDLDPFPGHKETYNGVQATYPDPDQLWEVRDAPGVYDADFEAADGGSREVTSLQFDLVPHIDQVKYLMRAWLNDARRFRQHTVTLPPDALRLNPLDAVCWDSARHGYDAKVFEADLCIVNGSNLTKSVVLRERDAGDYIPNPADDGMVDLPSTVVVAPPVIAVPGFDVQPVVSSNEDETRLRSGIRILWDQNATTFRGLKWRIRRADLIGDSLIGSTLSLSSGYQDVFEGVVPGQSYFVSAKILTNLKSVWSDEIEVLAPDSKMGPADLSQGVFEVIRTEAETVAGELITALEDARIAPLESEVTRVDRRLELQEVQQRSSAEVLGIMGDQILWAFTRLSDVDSRLADAGVIVDAETGHVRIYGVEQAAQRVSEVELRVSAAEASLTLSATQAWVNQQISYALTDPSQIPLLDDLQLIVNQVVIDLNAAEANIALKADQTVVDGLSASLTSAWVQIDAVNAVLALTVQRDEFDALEARQQTAEITLDALEGPSIRQTVADTRYLGNAQALADLASLEDLMQAYDQSAALRRDLAYGQQDLRALVREDRVARAAAETRLGAAIDDNVALLKEEQKVRATENSARVSEIATLQATTEAQDSAITEINRVAVDSASGIARAVHQVQLDVEAAEGEISATADALMGLSTRVTSSEALIAAVSQYALDLNTRLADAETGLAGQAQAQQILTTYVEQQNDQIKSHASALLDLETAVGENSASVVQLLNSVDGVMAEYTLRLDVNGHISGLVLRSELDDQGAPVSKAAFVADSFSIVAPDGSAESIPFTHYATPRVIDGRTYPAGTYLENVFIGQGMVGRLQIQDSIQSDDYAEDAQGNPTSGLKLNFSTGEIKTANVVISRNIVVAEGWFWAGGVLSSNPALGLHEVQRWDLKPTGVELPVDQVWMASNKTYLAFAAFEGEVSAPGTITGDDEFWGCKAEVQPFARWNGPQQLYLGVSLWAKGPLTLHRQENASLGGKIHWKLYEVT